MSVELLASFPLISNLRWRPVVANCGERTKKYVSCKAHVELAATVIEREEERNGLYSRMSLSLCAALVGSQFGEGSVQFLAESLVLLLFVEKFEF